MKQNDLTEEDIAIVKGMLKRGDEQHNIAAWFGINSGRISDINTNNKWAKKFKHVETTNAEILPPPGPYNSIIDIAYGITKVSNLKNKISDQILLRKIKALQSVLDDNFKRVAKEVEKRKKKELAQKSTKAHIKNLGLDSDAINKAMEQKVTKKE